MAEDERKKRSAVKDARGGDRVIGKETKNEGVPAHGAFARKAPSDFRAAINARGIALAALLRARNPDTKVAFDVPAMRDSTKSLARASGAKVMVKPKKRPRRLR